VSTMVAVHFITGGLGVSGVTPALAGFTAASLGFLLVFISRLRTYEPQRAV